ncbi:hypothetical protein [Terrabacter sp. NPDC080008]|uniref:hypothetical protein n=1 Tax=Terrabacter sp. NPDC080008 TaxID=3155176 RepID=UPI00344BAB4C
MVVVTREVVDAIAVDAAGARLRGCGEQVPRASRTNLSGQGALSVAAEAAHFDAIWGDGLSALRAELGLLASALHRASWARRNVERVNAQLLSHAGPVFAGSRE